MREIKFRFYMTDYQKMSEPTTVRAMSLHPHMINETDILMQFTSLRDKRGKEIYEGDIVRGKLDVDTARTLDRPRKPELAIIKWSQVGYFANGVNPLCYEDLEVLGNIYENEDLAKEVKDER